MLDVSGAPEVQPPAAAQPKGDFSSFDESSHLQDIMPAVLVLVVAAATLIVFLLSRGSATQALRQQAEYSALSGELTVAPLGDVARTAQQIGDSLRVVRLTSQKQLIWSKLLQDLQLTIQSNVTLSNLSVDEKNILTIEGRTDSYDSVAKYLATLRASSFVRQANLISAQLADSGNGRINFAFDVEFKPDLLRPTSAATPSSSSTPTASTPTTGGTQ